MKERLIKPRYYFRALVLIALGIMIYPTIVNTVIPWIQNWDARSIRIFIILVIGYNIIVFLIYGISQQPTWKDLKQWEADGSLERFLSINFICITITIVYHIFTGINAFENYLDKNL